MNTRNRLVVAALIGIALVASGCGDDDAGTSADPGPTATDAPDHATTGNRIVIGQFSPPAGLDPVVVSSAAGTVGGIELAAIYDTVVHYDEASRSYVPRTGELTSNDDFTSWTLTLKPDITFTDGTPYDAEAVKHNVERHMAPTSRSVARAVLSRFVASMTVRDPLTLEFTLREGWSGFPYLFSREVGMIASPTAIAEAGESFAIDPGDAGAGPFRVASYRPGESLVLTRNPTYYGGDVQLDEITFVMPTGGTAAGAYEGIKRGTLQAAYIRDDKLLGDATRDDYSIVAFPAPTGTQININSGVVVTCHGGIPEAWCADQEDGTTVETNPAPADARVRRAVAAAVDPEVVNERAYDGAAQPGTQVFQPGFPLYVDVPGPRYDPEEARRLVAEAKADGWDGKIRVLTANEPQQLDIGQSVVTMLEASGFDVEWENQRDIAGFVVQMVVNRDFDLAVSAQYGFTHNPDNIFVTLATTFDPGQPRYGFRSDRLQEAIDILRLANDDDDRRAALAIVQEVWTADVPTVVLGAVNGGWVHVPELQGVTKNDDLVLLDKAWLDR